MERGRTSVGELGVRKEGFRPARRYIEASGDEAIPVVLVRTSGSGRTLLVLDDETSETLVGARVRLEEGDLVRRAEGFELPTDVANARLAITGPSGLVSLTKIGDLDPRDVVRVRRGVPFAVRVVDSTGRGVEALVEAVVAAPPPGCAMPVVERSRRVGPGGATWVLPSGVPITFAAIAAGGRAEEHATAGAEPDVLLQIADAETLTLLVRSPDGRPASRARAIVRPEHARAGLTLVGNEEGEIVVPDAAHVRDIVVRLSGCADAHFIRSEAADQAGDLPVQMEPGHDALVRVVDEYDRPLPGRSVDVWDQRGDAAIRRDPSLHGRWSTPHPGWLAAPLARIAAVSRNDGTAILRGLPAGEYEWYVDRGPWVPGDGNQLCGATWGILAVPADESRLVVPVDCLVSLSVADALDHRPLTTFSLYVDEPASPTAAQEVVSGGTWQGRCIDGWTLVVAAPGYAAARVPVVADASGTYSRYVELERAPGGRLVLAEGIEVLEGDEAELLVQRDENSGVVVTYERFPARELSGGRPFWTPFQDARITLSLWRVDPDEPEEWRPVHLEPRRAPWVPGEDLVFGAR